MEKRFSPYIQPGAMLGLTLIFPRGSLKDYFSDPRSIAILPVRANSRIP